ncbi:aspartate aminotransferase family protein [Thiomicrorhabdus sp. ZW0627]|uniref:aspartate aminotransferase family protein n=1 Tax=Thiomicrorhabdus sp. ZW0627 TaxID=3039774 RepID=UPI002436A353|nr:aspartate aminotransferase family protein [Thiomicrorhabdus sp. ZW0627]MDG6774916.1 aspartate aminotransferase family protein [Thiomicrorhabdus sp. ZW0627]
MSEHLMKTYARLPVTFEKGSGALLQDTEGKMYLDAVSGIAVCSLGHAHPAVAEAICAQSQTLIHTSNLYNVAKQQELADKLIELSGMDRAFFCNSGAEANETALKIAKKYGHQKGIEKPAVIVMENSFHGRTMATLSATGNPKVHEGFTPLVEGFIRVPYDNVDAIKEHSDNQNIVAILVEPVQGEGGVHVPKAGYLKELKAVCEQNNWLLMLDEIQTGIGRTGAWFAFQHEGITPDVLTLAKALGNGVPIGCCMAKGEAAEVLVPGNHGTTFGGNPLACAAGLAVIEAMRIHNHVEHVAKKGLALLENFRDRLKGLNGVVDIRGKGYMIGIQLDRPCGDLVGKALEKGLLINVTRGDTIRLLPTFVMSTEQTEQLVSQLTQLITEFLSE